MIDKFISPGLEVSESSIISLIASLFTPQNTKKSGPVWPSGASGDFPVSWTQKTPILPDKIYKIFTVIFHYMKDILCGNNN